MQSLGRKRCRTLFTSETVGGLSHAPCHPECRAGRRRHDRRRAGRCMLHFTRDVSPESRSHTTASQRRRRSRRDRCGLARRWGDARRRDRYAVRRRPDAGGTGDQIQLLDTTRTDYTYGSGATASHARKWLATFAADQAGSIQMGSRLPSGNWTLSGSSTYTSGTNSYSLSVTTSDPLHYNTSCSVEPRFDSGTLTAVVTKGGVSTTVTIHFTACGQYTVVRS